MLSKAISDNSTPLAVAKDYYLSVCPVPLLVIPVGGSDGFTCAGNGEGFFRVAFTFQGGVLYDNFRAESLKTDPYLHNLHNHSVVMCESATDGVITQTLHINNATYEHGGTYTCVADGLKGAEKKSTEVVILGNISCTTSIDNGPFIAGSLSGLDLLPDNVTISCSVSYSGNIRPNIIFYLNGTPVADVSVSSQTQKYANYKIHTDIYTLKTEVKQSMNGHHFNASLMFEEVDNFTFSRNSGHDWLSPAIEIAYLKKPSKEHSYVASGDIAKCTVKSNLRNLEFKWTNDDNFTIAKGFELEVGRYTANTRLHCEVCLVSGYNNCKLWQRVHSVTVTDNQHNSVLAGLVAPGIVIILIIVVACIFRKRLRRVFDTVFRKERGSTTVFRKGRGSTDEESILIPNERTKDSTGEASYLSKLDHERFSAIAMNSCFKIYVDLRNQPKVECAKCNNDLPTADDASTHLGRCLQYKTTKEEQNRVYRRRTSKYISNGDDISTVDPAMAPTSLNKDEYERFSLIAMKICFEFFKFDSPRRIVVKCAMCHKWSEHTDQAKDEDVKGHLRYCLGNESENVADSKISKGTDEVTYHNEDGAGHSEQITRSLDMLQARSRFSDSDGADIADYNPWNSDEEAVNKAIVLHAAIQQPDPSSVSTGSVISANADAKEVNAVPMETATVKVTDRGRRFIQTVPEGGVSKILLAVVNAELFEITRLTRQTQSQIKVYSSHDLKLTHDINVSDMTQPVDLVGCSHNNCLYITDWDLKCIHRVDLSVDRFNKSVTRWNTEEYWPQGLSVTAEHDLLVTVWISSSGSGASQVLHYTHDGQLLHEILLDKSIVNVWQTVQLPSKQFILCHGLTSNDNHRVCLINTEGPIGPTFGTVCGPTYGKGCGGGECQLSGPRSVAVDNKGEYIFVADTENHRVLLFDSKLSYLGLVHAAGDLRRPSRLCVDSSNILFVAEQSGRISTINPSVWCPTY